MNKQERINRLMELTQRIDKILELLEIKNKEAKNVN